MSHILEVKPKKSISSTIANFFRKDLKVNTCDEIDSSSDESNIVIKKPRIEDKNPEPLPSVIIYESSYTHRPPLLPIVPLQRLKMLKYKQDIRRRRYQMISIVDTRHDKDKKRPLLSNLKSVSCIEDKIAPNKKLKRVISKSWSGDFQYDLSEYDVVTKPKQGSQLIVSNGSELGRFLLTEQFQSSNGLLSETQLNLLNNGTVTVKKSTIDNSQHEEDITSIKKFDTGPSSGFNFILKDDHSNISDIKCNGVDSLDKLNQVTKPTEESKLFHKQNSNSSSSQMGDLKSLQNDTSKIFSFSSDSQKNSQNFCSNQNNLNKDSNDIAKKSFFERQEPKLTEEKVSESSKSNTDQNISIPLPFPSFSTSNKCNFDDKTPLSVIPKETSTNSNDKPSTHNLKFGVVESNKNTEKNLSFKFGASTLSQDKGEIKPSFNFDTIQNTDKIKNFEVKKPTFNNVKESNLNNKTETLFTSSINKGIQKQFVPNGSSDPNTSNQSSDTSSVAQSDNVPKFTEALNSVSSGIKPVENGSTPSLLFGKSLVNNDNTSSIPTGKINKPLFTLGTLPSEIDRKENQLSVSTTENTSTKITNSSSIPSIASQFKQTTPLKFSFDKPQNTFSFNSKQTSIQNTPGFSFGSNISSTEKDKHPAAPSFSFNSKLNQTNNVNNTSDGLKFNRNNIVTNSGGSMPIGSSPNEISSTKQFVFGNHSHSGIPQPQGPNNFTFGSTINTQKFPAFNFTSNVGNNTTQPFNNVQMNSNFPNQNSQSTMFNPLNKVNLNFGGSIPQNPAQVFGNQNVIQNGESALQQPQSMMTMNLPPGRKLARMRARRN